MTVDSVTNPGNLSAAPAIAATGIDIRRRRSNFRLQIDRVEFDLGLTVIEGPNGAGKSTLLECLLGEHRRAVRELTFGGIDMHSSQRLHALGRIGYVPQPLTLPSHWRVGEYLHYAGWLRGVPEAMRSESVDTLTKRFDLPARSKIRRLSGGMKRKALVAQAFVGELSVVLLDEPFAGLDESSQAITASLLEEKAASTAVVVIDHTGSLAAVADRTLKLAEGRLC